MIISTQKKSMRKNISKREIPKKWAKSNFPTTAQLVWNRIFKQMESNVSTLQKAS